MTRAKINLAASGEDNFWHDDRLYPQAMGCIDCAFFQECGGISVRNGVFDCFSFCRSCYPQKCDRVCPRNADTFKARFDEVGGFPSKPLPQVEACARMPLPKNITLIKNASRRSEALPVSHVAIPLTRIVDLSRMSLRFSSRDALCRELRISSKTELILCGVGKDGPIEKFWVAMENKDVIDLIKSLRPALVTTPNYSLFSNVPRTDNLHSIRRIMVCWHELASAGIRVAPHLNARTDWDYRIWSKFLTDHPEISDVAFEFGTGAGYGRRFEWHLRNIQELYAETGGRLRVVVRGRNKARRISEFIKEVVLIDTETFVKAHKRQIAQYGNNGELLWASHQTAADEPLDELFVKIIRQIDISVSDKSRHPDIMESRSRRRKSLSKERDRMSLPVEDLDLFRQL